ncbi:WD40 repeat domain-containing protein [Streptomyces sp. NPDC004126]|uniref:WD40 repeat domain-containing protein n=1 Tax=Streptomyces sp. NPDC004126 TaxID=3390695 RepID=UPI003D035E10
MTPTTTVKSTALRAATALAVAAALLAGTATAATANGPAEGTVTPIGPPLADGDSAVDAAISPDGRYVAYTEGSAWWEDWWWIRLTDAATGKDMGVLPGSGSSSGNTAFSADGRYVGYSSARDETARIYDQVTKETTVLTPPGSTTRAWGRFEALTPDGRFVAYSVGSSGPSEFRVRDRTTGADQAFTPKAAAGRTGGTVRSVGLSRDGGKAAYGYDYMGQVADKGDVHVLDRATGTARQLDVTHNGAAANGSSQLVRLTEDGNTVYFNSAATNLLPTAVPAGTQAYRYDLTTNRLTHVGPAIESITDDGRYAVIQEDGLLYRQDRTAGTRVRIGTAKEHGYAHRAISADGKAYAFTTSDKAITGVAGWYQMPYLRRFE